LQLSINSLYFRLISIKRSIDNQIGNKIDTVLFCNTFDLSLTY
jgi:hypothetical protein